MRNAELGMLNAEYGRFASLRGTKQIEDSTELIQ